MTGLDTKGPQAQGAGGAAGAAVDANEVSVDGRAAADEQPVAPAEFGVRRAEMQKVRMDFSVRIGNQTAFAAPSALDPFEFAVAHGFDAFEFFPDRGPNGQGGWDERALSSAERDYLQRAARACGLPLTVHAPLAFDPLHDAHDARLHSTVEFAADIGAGLINLHLDLSRGVSAFARALLPTIEAMRDAGLKLALENTVWTGPDDFNQFFRHLDETMPEQAQQVGLCFDMGHANVCAATRNDYCEFLDRLSPEVPIIHLHLHENFGDRDSHLPLFTGPSRANPAGMIGLGQRLAGRGFAGCGIMEQWPQPPTLLVEARDRLRALWSTIA